MSISNHIYVRLRRTWIDVSSAASRRDGVLLYRPGRRLLRMVPPLLGALSFLPWYRLLRNSGFATFAEILTGYDLEKAVGPVEYATIYTGNGTAKSKFTLLAKRKEAENQSVIVKLGNNESASLAIRHEYEVLKRLQNSELKNQVPRPLGIGMQGKWTWASQTVLPHGKSSNTLKKEHFEFLDCLKRVNVTHGDFTPWNCSILDGKLLVWDWEDAGQYEDGKDIAWFKKQVLDLLGVSA